MSLNKEYTILIHSPGLRYNITFIHCAYATHWHSNPLQYARCLSHEPSLMTLAPTKVLGSLGFPFLVCLCNSLNNAPFALQNLLPYFKIQANEYNCKYSLVRKSRRPLPLPTKAALALENNRTRYTKNDNYTSNKYDMLTART